MFAMLSSQHKILVFSHLIYQLPSYLAPFFEQSFSNIFSPHILVRIFFACSVSVKFLYCIKTQSEICALLLVISSARVLQFGAPHSPQIYIW